MNHSLGSFLGWFIIQREPSDTANFSPNLKKDPAQNNNISRREIKYTARCPHNLLKYESV
jgi:hypothetical protein